MCTYESASAKELMDEAYRRLESMDRGDAFIVDSHTTQSVTRILYFFERIGKLRNEGSRFVKL